MTSVSPPRLAGAPNFRDLGGPPAAEGRRVAPGRIYRSEAFVALSPAEWETVDAIGFRLVCDLRSPAERTKHAVQWVGRAPRLAELTLLADVRAAGPELMRGLVADATGGFARTLLLENYAAMPAAFEPYFPDLIDSIVDRRELPLLINCTAGKDRTGFVCSLLLTALGVGQDAIVADYLKSNEWFDAAVIRASLAGWLEPGSATEPSDAVLDALICRPEYLAAALAAIVRSHGSVASYLERAGGLDRLRLTALRDALLE